MTDNVIKFPEKKKKASYAPPYINENIRISLKEIVEDSESEGALLIVINKIGENGILDIDTYVAGNGDIYDHLVNSAKLMLSQNVKVILPNSP